MRTEYERWGIPALKMLKRRHGWFCISREYLASIIEEEINRYVEQGGKLPKRFLGNLLAGIEERTHEHYLNTRPNKDVCPYCMGSGENTHKDQPQTFVKLL